MTTAAVLGPQTLDARRASFLGLITSAAQRHGVPAALADAVVRVESAYTAAAVGDVGEIGLMQVRPATAAMLGFRGTLAELAEPHVNVQFGVRYLAKAWQLAGGDLCRTLMKYRAGHGEERMSALSVEYCRRARLHLAATGAESLAAHSVETAERAVAASTREKPPLRPAQIDLRLPKEAGKPTHVAQASLRPKARFVAAMATASSKWGRSSAPPRGREHPFLAANRARIAEAYARHSAMHQRKALFAVHRAAPPPSS